MTKRSERLPPMGGSILLTVVAVLCLVTFSLLAIESQRYPQIVVEIEPLEVFYEAEEEHQHYLDKNPDGVCSISQGQIDWMKQILVDPAPHLRPSQEEILARLRAGETPDGVTGEDGVFSYACSIDDGRALQVRVRLDGTDYAVLQWQAVSTAPWQADDDLPVWQGGIQ